MAIAAGRLLAGPWIMTGRVVTAWFDLPFSVAERVLSPSLHGRELRERRGAGVPSRVRFYDVTYRCPTGGEQGDRQAGFAEAVVALHATAEGIDGEVSLFMWTDDDRYRAWGREVFGFPLLRGVLRARGRTLDRDVATGRRGSARHVSTAGVLRLSRTEIGQPIDRRRVAAPG